MARLARPLLALALGLAALGRPGPARADLCPEPNDRPAGACWIAEGAVFSGTLEAQDDVDLYRFTAAAGTLARAELRDLPADYDLYLLDADGTLLGQSVQEGAVAETLEVSLPLDGVYFLVVAVDPARLVDPNGAYTLALSFAPPPAAPAERAALPAPGAIVFEDALLGPGAAQMGFCPSRRNARLFVGDGYLLKVTGRCDETSTVAAVSQRLTGLTLPDGELRLELRPVSGADRARFQLWFREQPTGGGRYAVVVEPAKGLVQLVSQAGGRSSVLAQRRDLAAGLAGDRWAGLAVRALGPNLWVLLDDQPILEATDAAYATGGVSLYLARQGSLDDAAETGVLVRNLRLAALAEADPARAPSGPPRR